MLTEQHVALLRRAYVGWQDRETGAPEINPKRPYGNSSVEQDVAEILGVAFNEEHGLSERERIRLLALHRETERALQIVLKCGTFEPGLYVCEDNYHENWMRA